MARRQASASVGGAAAVAGASGCGRCFVRFRSRRGRCRGSSRALRLTRRLFGTGRHRRRRRSPPARPQSEPRQGQSNISRIWRRSSGGGPPRRDAASAVPVNSTGLAWPCAGSAAHRRRRLGDRRGFVGRRLGCLGERARRAGEQHGQGSRGEKPVETNTPHCKFSVGALATSAELPWKALIPTMSSAGSSARRRRNSPYGN